ncbi:hypothetical protein PF001_g4860 [Phytophthora fragariae]|uniref:Uncharacterized protein n=1 Tax=Phytophthora fragariae TaxID=53985 RepID=A0A6A4E8C2_9STRA|nr:hypothetical protein PF001_g4860 [Phytophthora fragariae]
MVAPAGKSPRHTLTEQERHRCLEALLSERHARRIRRADDKNSSVAQGKQKKATAKKGGQAHDASHGESRVEGCIRTHGDRRASEHRRGQAGGCKRRGCRDQGDYGRGGDGDGTSTRASGADATSSGKPKQRKHRRAVLQDESTSEVETNAGERDDARAEPIPNLQCIIIGDANLMATGAENCTELNSDEDPALPEEPESEEDGDDDEWVEDWTIGELTDEDLDEETMPLPDSVCLTAVRNKKTMSMMKTHR